MMKMQTILLAASAILAPTSIVAHLASNPSDPREDSINGAKKSVHRRRNKSTRLAQRSLGSKSSKKDFDDESRLDSKSSKKGFYDERQRNDPNAHSSDTKENTMQKVKISEAMFNMHGSPGKGTDTVMAMDDDFSMPAVDVFVLLPLQESETAPVILNEMLMEFPVMSMGFTETPLSADGENGSTTAATMAASSGGTITATKASRASKMLPPSPSDATMTTATIASIEEVEPEDMITIVGEHLPSSSSVKSPILIASVVAGALFMMW